MANVNRVKKSYPGWYSFEKDDIAHICDDLRVKGFTNQSWKVPINNDFDVGKGVLSTEKYFRMNYNFSAVIGVFENPKTKDVIKVMFVNNSSSMKRFSDFTFPSSQSEGPKYYVESDDEIRVVGLADYIKRILKKYNRNKGPQYALGSMFNWISIFYIIGYFAGFRYVAEHYSKLLPLANVFIVLAIVTIILYSISIKRGVYINSFPHPFLSFIDQMIKGSFIENPITYVFIRLIAVAFTGIIGSLAFSIFQSIFNTK